MSNVKFVDRPPRIQPELPTGVVEIPAPPRTDEGQQPIWQSLVPIITIIGYMLVSVSGQGANLAFMLPMALAIFVSTGLAVYNAIATRRRRVEAQRAYAQKLIEMRREMVNAHNRQRTFYEYNYPAPDFVVQMRGDRRDNRGGSRLWERRASDADFGVVRLGMGTRPSTVTYKVNESGSSDSLSPQMQDAQRLATDSHYVTDVPLTLGLYQPPIEKKKNSKAAETEEATEEAAPPIVRANPHALGISGAPKDVYPFVHTLVSHFTAFHSPSDASVSVLGLHDAAPNWGWAYALPHAVLNSSKGQFRLYFEDHERVFSPVSGVVRKVAVKPKDVVSVGQPLFTIQDEKTGALVTIHSLIAARVQEIGRVAIDGSVKLIDVGHRVDKGALLLRFEAFELAMQQLEEELDPQKLQQEFGKKRNREIAGVSRFWKEKLWSELDRRSRRLRDRDENDHTNVALPFMLIVVDLMAARPDLPDDENPLKNSWLDELESEAAISLLMGQGAALGAAILFLVPQRNKVPSGCQGVVELKRDPDGALKFLYAETGLNTTRYVGTADTITDEDTLAAFARQLAEWEVRRSYGADIPSSVGLLELYQTDSITGLDMGRNWGESTDPKRAEWPKMPLAMMAGRERRWLHFFADADGVHGMIAGSTGSGKSELLMTMILSLAVKYDPSAVNFVLIDFKGGAAFEPFKELPHVVDVITNLGPNAVARMFAAINAELNRRQRVNQDNDVKDIMRYRKAGLHLERNDNYPHLFIIIDEFAEMIATNPEYKAQLDSITRLGRALGVSLILAAQRPTGVTDQMRANIKFRIALRVETREESSELLRLPDASYLPSIPGRGYLQVGSESLELIQVGYTGESYTRADYSPLERYESRGLIWESDLGREEDEPMYDVMVRRMIKLANQKYPDRERRPWRKPWPSPLPAYLSLDQTEGIEVNYLVGDDYDFSADVLDEGQPFSLAPEINQWMRGRTEWRGIDWGQRAMRAVIGLMDDAANAKLRTLRVDFTLGHYLIIGASGWGKSVTLRSVLTSLITSHAPDELHLYMMDFGNRSLQVFEDLPHTGAYIVSHEKERIERLMRKLEQIVEERKEIISAANVSNAAEYNQLDPRKRRADAPAKLPAVLVAVDNFAEFKETYEAQLDVFTSLVREGLSNGLHFIVTGEQSSAVGKLFNLLPERITLKLSDDSEYSSVVGRGARPVDEIAGRGLRRLERNILEVQVAMPLGLSEDDETRTENDRLLELLNILKKAGEAFPRPPQIIEQEKLVNLRQVLAEVTKEPPVGVIGPYFVAGRSDYDLSPAIVALDQKQHFVISGQPSTGKTTALQTFILSLADRFSPQEAVIALVDYQGGLADYGGTHRLDHLPHVADQRVINEQAQMVELVEHLENEFIHARNRPPRDVFVFIDTYEEMDELTAGAPIDVRKRLGDLARRYGKAGLHFIIAGMRSSLGSSDELIRPVSANRYGLAMDAETAESSPFYGAVPRSYTQSELPRGRGFIVVPGKVSPVQMAVPFKDPAQRVPFMDDWIGSILARGQQPAAWLTIAPRTGAEVGAAAATDRSNGNDTVHPGNGAGQLTVEQRERMIARWEQVKEAEPGSLRDSLMSFDDDTLLTLMEAEAIDISDITE